MPASADSAQHRHPMTEPAHQLPTPDTRLVLAGRVLDLDAGVLRDAQGAPISLRPQAWAVLARHRLVTIVGAGGVGKTAITVAAARSLAGEVSPKPAWVDLAQLADPQLLVATIARSLGLPIAQGGDQLTGLLAGLAPLSA